MRTRLIAAAISSLVLAGGVVGLGGSPVDAQAAQGPPAIAAGAVRLDGGQEVPPADPDGRGIFAYVAIHDRICYVLTPGTSSRRPWRTSMRRRGASTAGSSWA